MRPKRRSAKQETADDLARQYIPLALTMAAKWFRYAHCEDDRNEFRSVAKLGLVLAARDYRVEVGPFAAFARIKIEGALRDYVRARDPMSRGLRDMRKRIVRETEDLERVYRRSPTRGELAVRLGIKVDALEELLSATVPPDFVPLDGPFGGGQAADNGRLPDETIGLRDEADALLGRLDERRRRAMTMHFIEEQPLKQVSMALDVGESRACQLIGEAVEIIRLSLRRDEAMATRAAAVSRRRAA